MIQKKLNVETNTTPFLVFYDISDGYTRDSVCKYLLKKGCLRLQRSVFIGNLPQTTISEIKTTLKAIHDSYENEDSYIVIPLRKENIDDMMLAGDRINLDVVLRRSSMMFF